MPSEKRLLDTSSTRCWSDMTGPRLPADTTLQMEMKKPWWATLIRAPLSCLAPRLTLNVSAGYDSPFCSWITWWIERKDSACRLGRWCLLRRGHVHPLIPLQSFSTVQCFPPPKLHLDLFSLFLSFGNSIHDILCTLGADPSKTPQYARGASVFRKMPRIRIARFVRIHLSAAESLEFLVCIILVGEQYLPTVFTCLKNQSV